MLIIEIKKGESIDVVWKDENQIQKDESCWINLEKD